MASDNAAVAVAEKKKGAKAKGDKAQAPAKAEGVIKATPGAKARAAGGGKGGKAAAGVPARPMTAAGIRTAIKALGEGAVEAYDDLDSMFRQEEQSKLSFWWNVGQKFNTVTDRWKEEGLTTFCTYLGKNHREVRMAMRAATLYTEDQILGIVDAARKHNGSVTWSHVRTLLTLDDADRERYLAIIQKEKMGYEQLVAKIEADRGPKATRGKKGGRKFNIPGTFDGLYQASLRQTTTFERFFDQMGKKLPDAIDKIDEGRFSTDLLARVRKMREQCDHVVEHAQGRADELVNFERRIEQKLGLQPDEIPPPAANGEAKADRKQTVRKPPSAAKKKGD